MRRPLILAIAMAMALLYPAAASAHTATIGATCDGVTFSYVHFPQWPGLHAFETVKVDGKSIIDKQQFEFTGPSATHVVKVGSLTAGTHVIDAGTRWWVDGGGQVWRKLTVSCACPPPAPSPCTTCPPGPAGPVGPPGPAGPAGPPGQATPPTVVRINTNTVNRVTVPSCVSRRVNRTRIIAPLGATVRRLRVTFEGRRAVVRRIASTPRGRHQWRLRVDMRGLRRGVYVVRVRAVVNGRSVVRVHYYRPCYGNPKGGGKDSLNRRKVIGL